MITKFNIFEDIDYSNYDPFTEDDFHDHNQYDWKAELRNAIISNNYMVYSERELINLTKHLLKELGLSNKDFNVAKDVVSFNVKNYIDDWKYEIMDSISDGLSESDILINIINYYDFKTYDITKDMIRDFIQQEIKRNKINKFKL